MTEIPPFFDDASINDDEALFRRIRPDIVNWDLAEQGVPPIPRQGFQDYSESKARLEYNLPGACMSVDRDRVLVEHGCTSEDLIDGFHFYGVVSLEAGAVRNLTGTKGEDYSQGVMANPLPGKPWHAVIFSRAGGKKSKGIENALARLATWVILPRRPQV